MYDFGHPEWTQTRLTDLKTTFLPLALHLFYKYGSYPIRMKRTYLGEFEEVVLLTVAVLGAGAYGVAITNELDRHTDPWTPP